MNKFAFMIHPIEIDDVARKFGILGNLPENWIEKVTKLLPPLKVSRITGVASPIAKTEGMFVGCPLTTSQMLNLPEEYVLKRIIQTGKLAEKNGAEILGLGAMTSVVGDAGITVAKNLGIAVTTGNSYTIYTAVEGAVKAAEMMGISIPEAQVAVVGATGSIGAVCAQLMAGQTDNIVLVARNQKRLEEVAERINKETGVLPTISGDVSSALKQADIVITVTSAIDTVIKAEDLKSGAVVCDVARPRDVSKQVVELRDDVLVIEGGVVEIPGDVNFNFNFGYEPKTAYACMAETMILALEGRIENFTLGRELTIEQVLEIGALAKKHGFKLAGFRSFERPVTQDQIESVRAKAYEKKELVMV